MPARRRLVRQNSGWKEAVVGLRSEVGAAVPGSGKIVRLLCLDSQSVICDLSSVVRSRHLSWSERMGLRFVICDF